MAIAQQLQAESTQQNNISFSQAVTLGAGSNRLFLVAIIGERTSYAAPTNVTYGGNALSLVTDGAQTAENITGTNAGVHLYALKEASLPANGSNTLAVNYSGANVNYVVGWWILTGVNQGNSRDVKVLGQTTTATSITITLDSGATTDAVICAAYKNDSTGTIAITISGAAVTEDFDVDLTTGGARGAAGTDLPAVASGTIACVATVSSTTRRIIVGTRLIEAPNVNTSTMALTGVPVQGSGTGSVDLGEVVVPEFVSISVGAARNIEVTAGTSLLILAICRNDAVGAGSSATLGGVGLNVANNSNDWTQMFYMLNPPEGIAAIAASGSNITNIIAVQYTGVSEFVSAQQGSVLSHSFNPARAAVMPFSMSFAGGGTPLADTTERFDTGGDYYADRIVASGGTGIAVGCSAGSAPDSVAALFLAPESGDEPNAGTMALTGVAATGSGTGAARLTSTAALTGVPAAGTGTAAARLTSTAAFTGAPVAGSGTGSVRLTSTATLIGVPAAGSGSGSAQLNATQSLVGIPTAGTGTASARLASSAALVGVPVSGTGTASVVLQGSMQLVGAPVEGSGTGDVIPVTVMALTGVPVEGSGTGSARLASTMALVGTALAGAGTAAARLLATQALTGVPVAGSGTASARLTATAALTGAPVAGAGTGDVKLTATMTLTGAPIEGSGTGSVPSPIGMNLTGVPVQGSGTGAALLTGTFQLSGVPVDGSGTASAKLTAQLNITGAPVEGAGTGQIVQGASMALVGVPVEGSGAGSASLAATQALTGAPLQGSGDGAARLLATAALTGAPVAGSGLGSVQLRATMELTGARITGSGTGSRTNPFFDGVMELTGVIVFGTGTGSVTAAPTGDTQAQVGEDTSSAGTDLDAGHVQIGSAGAVVLVSQDNGVTVVITSGITNVKVG